MADIIKQIQVGDTTYGIALPADSKDTMFYTTTSATANAFTVTVPDITALSDGLVINVRFNATTATNCTLNVNNLGAKRIEYRVGSFCTSHISKDMYITLAYNASGNSNAGTWVMQGHYDASDQYGIYEAYVNATVGTTAVVANSLVGYGSDGKLVNIVSSNAKAPFKYKDRIYWAGSALNASSSGTWRNLYTIKSSGTIVAAACNSVAWTAAAPVYLRGTITNNLFNIDTEGGNNGVTLTLPSSADNKFYLLLGYATAAATAANNKVISLQYDHPVYYYDNGIKVLGAIDETNLVHKGTSSSSVAETVYGTKTFYDSVIASTSTSSTGSWLGNDGTLTLKKGSGSDSPAYIDFTGVSGNSGTVRLKSGGLTSGTATVVIPAASGTLIVENSNSHQAKVADGWMAGTNPYAIYRSRSIELGTSSNPSWILTLPTKTGTILTDADLVSADNLVTTDETQTITGRKTFSTPPVINAIWDSTKNSTIANFSYSSLGSSVISSGNFIANGDDDSGVNKPTDNTGASDLDTYYCNTGITLTDADGEINDIKLAFPSSSGTLATLDKIQGIFYCNTTASTTAKTASCDNFVSLTSSTTKWYIMRVNVNNTSTSTLTLNVNGTGAKTLNINGSSAPGTYFVSGTYIGYYNASWYFFSLIPTTTSTSMRYLLGSASTTATNRFETNSSCYMLNGYLYSSGNVTLTCNSSSVMTSGPTGPTTYNSVTTRYYCIGYGSSKLLINYGAVGTANKTTTVSFGKNYTGYTPYVIIGGCSSGDTQTQRFSPTSISTTGFTMGNNTGQAVEWIAIGYTNS